MVYLSSSEVGLPRSHSGRITALKKGLCLPLLTLVSDGTCSFTVQSPRAHSVFIVVHTPRLSLSRPLYPTLLARPGSGGRSVRETPNQRGTEAQVRDRERKAFRTVRTESLSLPTLVFINPYPSPGGYYREYYSYTTGQIFLVEDRRFSIETSVSTLLPSFFSSLSLSPLGVVVPLEYRLRSFWVWVTGRRRAGIQRSDSPSVMVFFFFFQSVRHPLRTLRCHFTSTLLAPLGRKSR